MGDRTPWTVEEETLLRERYPNGGSSAVCGCIHRTRNSVQAKARKLGLRVSTEARSKETASRIIPPRPGTRNVPMDGFVNTTPETAYLLGLIWADGYVAKPGSSGSAKYRISVEMLTSDMEEVVPVFYSSGKWLLSRRTRSGREREVMTLQTSNKELWALIEPHKRDPLPLLSTMDAELRPYWFRGMFDGDGNHYNPNSSVNQMTVAGHADQDWGFLTPQLDDLGISWTLMRRTHKARDGSTSSGSIVRWTSAVGCAAWYDYTHAPGMKGFGLSRKRPTR